MKVAYFSNYKDVSGYSSAALGYINSLRTVSDIKLSTRNVSLVNEKRAILVEEEKNDLENVDICIQHSLPDFFQKTKAKKNVGYFAWETDTLPKKWIENINLSMDAVIVPNEMERVLFERQLDIPVYNLRHANEFQDCPVGNMSMKEIGENTHVFYTIGSFDDRKNINSLIISYFTEFTGFDDCVLFLHCSSSNYQQELDKINDSISFIKKVLKLPSYPKVIVNTKPIADDVLLRLHNLGDTYCSISKGESWGIPAHTANALSKNLILSECGGYLEIDDDNLTYVSSMLSPCFKVDAADMPLYSGEGCWLNPSILDTGAAMRKYFNKGKCKSKLNEKKVKECSYDSVGKDYYKILKGILNG